MTLTTEETGDLPCINAAAMDELLETDGFGKFAVLCSSEGVYIQAADDWQVGATCKAFMQAHDSDPWVLEYREGGQQFRVAGWVTLSQVRAAFRSYLAGGSEWRTRFAWGAMEG